MAGATSEHAAAVDRGGIILCGGKSSRMGRDKATLPFGDELMLQRVVRLLAQVVPLENVVVVAATHQSLPSLPNSIAVAYDRAADRGPLEGLAAGLAAMPSQVGAVYATACDVPLLVPAFVNRMFELLGPHDIVVPCDGDFHHPLASVYRPAVLGRIRQLLAADRLRPRFLFDEASTRRVPLDELRTVDPCLSTLENLNFEADYLAALQAAGIAQPGQQQQ